MVYKMSRTLQNRTQIYKVYTMVKTVITRRRRKIKRRKQRTQSNKP